MAQKTNAKRKEKSKTKPNQKPSSARKTHRQQLKAELQDVTGITSRGDYLRFGSALILLIVALFLLIAMISNIFTGGEDQSAVMAGNLSSAQNYGGILGAYASYYLMHQLFGVLSLLIPLFLLAIVVKLVLQENNPIRLWPIFLHLFFIIIVGSVGCNYVQEHLIAKTWQENLPFELGGMHGKETLNSIETYVGTVIAGVLLLLFTIGYIGYWFTQVLIWLFKGFQKMINFLLPQRDASSNEEEIEETEEEEETQLEEPFSLEEDGAVQEKEDMLAETPSPNDAPAPTIELCLEESCSTPMGQDCSATEGAASSTELQNSPQTPSAEEELAFSLVDGVEEQSANASTVENDDFLPPYDPKLDLSRYQYPPLSLLEKHDAGNKQVDMAEQNANKERIITVLSNFHVKITAISATIGPTVTLYEITPAPGVPIAKIRKLEDDIALSLSALGIRIIAPIPGKGTIGIEVPNRTPQIVSMESIINTQKFQETKFDLPIALGKTITNEVFMVDLAKMPHLLVAGATGQGKSVGLNALITSLLYKKHPAELKLVMVDPKKVEFSMYTPLINHFLAQVPDSDEPVITDVKKVVQTLKSLCQEMDDRYDLLKRARCKNIKEYNAKFTSRHLNPNEGHRFLPYIVVIIDEFGDLIMTAGKDIELPIARIAQLARAVGIHMVIATQSPRTTIITGKIKANFPGRIAFKVTNRVESSTILDRTGANNLIGRGDMLFLHGSDTTRVQCAFVDTPEVEAITRYIEEQQGYPIPYELPLVAEDGSEESSVGYGSNEGSTFEAVARFVVNTQQGSTSKIQRTFSIGFNRAGRLMDKLEEAGIVGPVNGAKPREVYVQTETELQQILEQLRASGKSLD